jgi:hypothetical protein
VAYARRLEQWIVDSKVQNDMQRFFVERAVHASWKMERGESVENGLIADNMVNIAAAAEEADIQATEQLAARLNDDPGVIRQMRNTPAGCRYILSKVSILEQRLSQYKGLRQTQRHMLLNLLGKQMSDVFRDDPLATRYVIAELSAALGNQDVDADKVAGRLGQRVPEGMSRVEYDERLKLLADSLIEQKEGKTKLKAYLAEFKSELTEHLKVIEELTEYKRAQAILNARIDLGPQGKQLLQYQRKHEASCEANLRRVAALQKPQPPPPGPARTPKKSQAPAPTSEAPAPVPTQAAVAVAPPAPAPAGEPQTNGRSAAGTDRPGAAGDPPTLAEVPAGTNRPGAAGDPPTLAEVAAGTNRPGAAGDPPTLAEVAAGTNRPGAAFATKVPVQTRDCEDTMHELPGGAAPEATAGRAGECSFRTAEVVAGPPVMRPPPVIIPG